MLVGGALASNANVEAVVRDYLPLVFAFVLSLSFLRPMLAFHSLAVPLEAIVLNLHSVGTAYGLLVTDTAPAVAFLGRDPRTPSGCSHRGSSRRPPVDWSPELLPPRHGIDGMDHLFYYLT